MVSINVSNVVRKMDELKRVVIYTALFGDYDELPESIKPHGVDCICFTDQAALSSEMWKIVYVDSSEFLPNVLNRRYKFLPHEYLREYDYSIYVDANIAIVGSPLSLFDELDDQHPIAMYRHPFRDNLFDEAKICLKVGYSAYLPVVKQLKNYVNEGYDGNGIFFECGVIVRRHLDARCITLMRDWLVEYSNGIKRDQISLPYVSWKHQLDIVNLGNSDPRFYHKLFKLNGKHKKGRALKQKLLGVLNYFIILFYWKF